MHHDNQNQGIVKKLFVGSGTLGLSLQDTSLDDEIRLLSHPFTRQE